jgi:MGT family glycosyltransferase
MARFLIATIPVIGHVTPAIPIVKRLVEAGHEVRWYTGQGFRSKIEATGATYLAMRQATDYSDSTQLSSEMMAHRGQLQGIPQLIFDLKYIFIEGAIGQLADLMEIIQDYPADVLLSDALCVGASWFYEKVGLPWAQLGVTIFMAQSRDLAPIGLGLLPNSSWLGRLRNQCLNQIVQQLVFREVRLHTIKVRTQCGLPAEMPAVFDIVSPFLYLSPNVPGFEYPRSDLPPQFHFIGPLVPAPIVNADRPWLEKFSSPRPIVHVTQGTVSNEPTQLLLPTLAALADEEVWVIATTGNQPISVLERSQIPENAYVESFIPYGALLPQVDVMVTNGGFNGVQAALGYGMPLVVAGRTEEKPEVCARVAWSGAGIDLKTQTPTPEQIRLAVREVLQNPQYRQAAVALQAEIQARDPVGRAIALLEQLAKTKLAVTQQSA